MAIKIGINGFGRIGRMVMRAVHKDFTEFEIVAINDLLDIEYLAYMLKYDSIHGRFNKDIKIEQNHIIIDNKKIRITAEKNPENINWAEVDTDLVIDCTGIFLTKDLCQAHIKAGAKKVLQSAPAKDNTPMFVYGVNHEKYNDEKIISAASCTTNCLAPIAKILNENWGLKRGLMTTVHAVTASQKTVDGCSNKDWRGGRSILDNIIPSSTGAAKAAGIVLPELKDKLTGMSFRIPTADVSVVDLTFELNKDAQYEDICEKVLEASKNDMKGVLSYVDEKVVSKDFIGSTYASIFDASAGIALDKTFMKVVAWYDNEYSYTCNLLRLANYIFK